MSFTSLSLWLQLRLLNAETRVYNQQLVFRYILVALILKLSQAELIQFSSAIAANSGLNLERIRWLFCLRKFPGYSPQIIYLSPMVAELTEQPLSTGLLDV